MSTTSPEGSRAAPAVDTTPDTTRSYDSNGASNGSTAAWARPAVDSPRDGSTESSPLASVTAEMRNMARSAASKAQSAASSAAQATRKAAAPAPAAAKPATTKAKAKGPRRVRLAVARVDPWSVMKTAFMLSISIGIVVLMATALLWWTLDVTGVFAAVGRTIDDVAGSGTSSFDFLSLVGFSRVMGVALVLTAIEVVLGSALATLFAFLYNLSVGLTGGLEVTLSEDS